MEDGIYFKIIAVKDNAIHDTGRVISLQTFTKMITEKMCDGIEETITKTINQEMESD